MPSKPFDLINWRGQLQGDELNRLAQEVAGARQLSLPAGAFQAGDGVVIPPSLASSGGSLTAVRVYSPAAVTSWTPQGGSTVTPTPGAGAFSATTIAAGSDGAALPAATINVASTTGFPSAGTLQIVIPGQTRLNTVTYTGTTSTTFTGCTGGTGTIHTNYSVFSLSQYTWSLPAGLLFARVWTVGAGGRGGTASLPNVSGGGVPGMAAAGGGGSGGGCAYKTFAASALQSSMSVLAGMGSPGGISGYAQQFNYKGRVSQFTGSTVLLSATGGSDGNNGGVTSIGTLINLANNSNYDNDGVTVIAGRAAFAGGSGGTTEDGNPGGVGDLNWQGEAGGYGLIAPDYQTGIAGASTGGTAAASTQGARAYGAGTPGGTGPGVPGGLPGSLGFTLIELIGSYIYPVGPQFNAVGGRGGRAGGPNSGGGPYGYLTSLFDSLGSGTGGSGGVLTWPYALPGATPPPGNGKYGGRGADGMVVIEEYS